MPVSLLAKKIVRKTGILFFVALAAWVIPFIFEFPITYYFPIGHKRLLTETLPHYVAVIALFLQALIWNRTIVSHWADNYIQRNQADRNDASTIRVIAILIRLAISAILFVIAFDALGHSVTTLVTTLGIGGVAIAFALQNILGDIFGAVSIAFDKPFVVGDAVQVDDFSGTVEKIGLKSTRVRADSGEQIVFANGELLKGRIRNYGRMGQRRTILLFKFSGSTPPEQLAKIPAIIKEVVTAQQTVRFDRSHVVGFTDTTIDVETVYYLTDPAYKLFVDTRQTVILTLMDRFAAEGIELAVQLEAAQRNKVAGR